MSDVRSGMGLAEFLGSSMSMTGSGGEPSANIVQSVRNSGLDVQADIGGQRGTFARAAVGGISNDKKAALPAPAPEPAYVTGMRL